MLSLLLIVASSLAAPDGRIDHVVVMADRAEVTRVNAFACAKGRASVRFGLLPASLDPRTLRAEASGGAEVLGLSHRRVPLLEDRNAKVAALDKELEALRARIRELDDRAVRQIMRSTTVAAYGQHFLSLWREEIRNPSPRSNAEWSAVVDQLLQQRLALVDADGEVAHERRALERQVQVLSRTIARLAPDQAPEGVEVKVAVACTKQAGEASLSYVLPGATWKPEYDLRFVPTKPATKIGPGRVAITVATVVRQATGEDWTDAQLTLSTAKPKLGSEAPRPARIRVSGQERVEGQVMVEAKEQRKSLATRRGPSGPAAVPEFEDRGHSFALVVPRRVTVKADGRPYWLPVSQLSGAATSTLVAVPKLRPYVFRAVKFDNPAPYPLLAGAVHVYRQRDGVDAYVGDAGLAYKGPGEPVELSLGIDEELRVTRKDVGHRYEEAGAFSSTQTLRRGYVIELTNNGAAATTVELRENVPVSKSGEIEVEIVKDRTSGAYELDAYRGMIVWQVKLDRGEKAERKLGFTIGLPESWRVPPGAR